MRNRKWLLVGGLSLVLFLITILPAMAQPAPTIPVTLRYPVKFVCGIISTKDGPDAYQPLSTGTYHTAINIHNPALPSLTAPTEVTLGAMVSVSSTNCEELYENNNLNGGYAQHPGPTTPFYRVTLKANEAFEIDCKQIFDAFDIRHSYWMKGFVVIMSPVELDVTAVHTGRPGAFDCGSSEQNQVSTIDVETIQPRPQRATIPVIEFENPG